MSSVFSLKNFVRTLSLSLPLSLIFFDNVAYIARVDGVSMQPTLNPEDIPSLDNNNLSFKKFFYKFNSSDLILLSHWSTRNYQIERGFIVSLVSPKNPHHIIIKRVIGLEGDIVVARRNRKYEAIKIPKGHCWVEGDNHCKSLDSNIFGPVAVGLITGQAKYVIWPPKRWKFLANELPFDRKLNELSMLNKRKYNGTYSSGQSYIIELKDGPHFSTNSLSSFDLIGSTFDDDSIC